jgi:enoyl-CoA hydratase
LALSGRNVGAAEAERIGLVNTAYNSYEEMIEAVSELAQSIARKSPLAVRGTKEMIRYSRDHSVEDALNYVATWNAGMLSQEDAMLAISAANGESPDFKD